MSRHDIGPLFCIFLIFAFGGAALTIAHDGGSDGLALHNGDMPAETFYTGDVVARYAAMPRAEREPVDFPDPTGKNFLRDIWKHMGADKASTHTRWRF